MPLLGYVSASPLVDGAPGSSNPAALLSVLATDVIEKSQGMESSSAPIAVQRFSCCCACFGNRSMFLPNGVLKALMFERCYLYWSKPTLPSPSSQESFEIVALAI